MSAEESKAIEVLIAGLATQFTEVRTALTSLEEHVRQDVNGIHGKLEERDKNGCGYGRVLNQKEAEDRRDIDTLQAAPDKKAGRAASTATVVSVVIAALALLVAAIALIA